MQPLYFKARVKPDSVPLRVFIIYLAQLTPRQRTGSPWMPIYIALQDAVEYPRHVAITSRELLPRVFTLTSSLADRGGCFLLPRT